MKATAGASSVIGCTLRGLPSVIGGLKVTRSGGRKFDPPARGSRRLRVDSEERPTIDRHPATTDDRIVSTRLLVVAQTRVRDQLAAHAARVADRRRVLSDVPGRRLHLPRDDEARRSGRHADLHELSPEALPPLGIAFALVAALPTGDFEHHQRSSQTTVNDEASSLRAAVLLVHSVSRASEAKKRFLIARHIDQRGAELAAHDYEHPRDLRRCRPRGVAPSSSRSMSPLASQIRPRFSANSSTRSERPERSSAVDDRSQVTA